MNKLIRDKVVVAMSGGVDSSVAALLLHREGLPIVGVSMQVWDYRNHGGCSSRATCCAPSDFADARLVCQALNVPYYVFDFEKEFQEKVISKFIQTYAIGETPNPCVDCNNDVKFRELRTRALSFGGTSVATGHYARIKNDPDGYRLFRAKDDRKDQSYFLYGLRQEELSQTLFPLAPYSKEEVRELAREAGFTVAEKPESQDICFVSTKADDFVSARIGDMRRRGTVRDKMGNILARHDGIHRFTRGQRKGIGVSGSKYPLYVIDIERETGTVVVGPREDLEVHGFSVCELNWISPHIRGKIAASSSSFEFESMVQVRHRHRGVRSLVRVLPRAENPKSSSDLLGLPERRVEVCFLDDWTTPAPGQAAVFYDIHNQEVLGGGRIFGAPTRSRAERFEEGLSFAV